MEIENLPASITLHEDTTAPILVHSFNVNPTTATCTILTGNDGGKFQSPFDAGIGKVIPIWKELVVLLNLSPWCLLMAEGLFLAVP